MKAISFYNSNVNPELVEYQRKVFAYFGMRIEQVLTDLDHATAIDMYLRMNDEWETIAIFDIDCIPLNKTVLVDAEKTVKEGWLYGAAQNANHLQDFVYCSPAFCCFSKETYEQAGMPTFQSNDKYDVGGFFTSHCKKVKLLWPVNVEIEKWRLTDHRMFGYGTNYQNTVYHAFESRFNHSSTSMFIDKCKEVLGE